jgi:glycosyltransferase involved in cell wall biosynthesis
MTKTSVLFAHNVAKIGGAEKVTLDIIRNLDSSQFSCHLLTPEPGDFNDQAEMLGANTLVMKAVQPSKGAFLLSWQFTKHICRYLKENHITIIHTGDIFIARALMPAVKKSGIQLICHMHFPPDDGALKWVFAKPPEKLTFIYCSDELRNNVKPRVSALAPNASHTTIHNGVDTDKFRKNNQPNQLLSVDKTNIGIVANLQERKGHNEFIESAQILIQKHNNLMFHIIGGDIFGEQREPILKELVENTGLDDFFIFHGQVNNVKDYLNELDIYVCSSHEEAFPISILEAMACGLPIASTNVNGIPEALVHETNALLFDCQDAIQQAEAIDRLLTNSELKEKIANAARATVIEKFSDQIFIKAIT